MYKKRGGLWKSEIKEGRSQQQKLYHFNIQTLEGLSLGKLKTGQGYLEIKVSKLENPHTKSVSSSLICVSSQNELPMSVLEARKSHLGMYRCSPT